MEQEVLNNLFINTPWNKNYERVSSRLRNLKDTINLYCNLDEEEESIYTLIDKKIIVPNFQRDNNKWTMKMQQKFVLNVLKGMHTEIILFKVKTDNFMILDGLQRLTAIGLFLENKLVIEGNNISFKYSDIKERSKRLNTNITFKLFTFNTEKEAIKFYIDMNEGFTHSEEDIEKARRLLGVYNV